MQLVVVVIAIDTSIGLEVNGRGIGSTSRHVASAFFISLSSIDSVRTVLGGATTLRLYRYSTFLRFIPYPIPYTLFKTGVQSA